MPVRDVATGRVFSSGAELWAEIEHKAKARLPRNTWSEERDVELETAKEERMLISFAWTTPALRARVKSVTRRTWTPAHAAHFHAGDLVDAWDKLPRAGGKKIGQIRITRDPYRQRTSLLTNGDRAREGIDHLERALFRPPEGFNTWDQWWRTWKRLDEEVWVVEFEIVEMTA